MLGNGEEKRGGNLIGKRYTISSFKVSNDARQRIKFHQNLTFILPFCKRKEEHHFLRYAPPNSLISGRGFVWKEKKRVRKRQINKTANEWVLGKVCRKSYTIRHGRVSPPGCFSLLLRFPLKKKKMIDSIISEIGVWKLHTSLSRVEKVKLDIEKFDTSFFIYRNLVREIRRINLLFLRETKEESSKRCSELAIPHFVLFFKEDNKNFTRENSTIFQDFFSTFLQFVTSNLSARMNPQRLLIRACNQLRPPLH